MTRFSWQLVNIVSRMLEPAEREVILGDIEESGETDGRALRGVLGLVIRRQLELWKDWQPWLALIGLVVIAGPLLSRAVFLLDMAVGDRLRGLSILWTDPSETLLHPTFDPFLGKNLHIDSMTVAEDIAYLAGLAIGLALWSWVSGFVLGLLSHRTVWLIGPLFCLVVLDYEFTRLLIHNLTISGAVHWPVHAPPIPWLLLDWLLPRNFAALMLFIVPLFLGLNHGLLGHRLGGRQLIALTGAIAIFSSMWIVQQQFMLGRLLLLNWPLAYIAATSWRQRPDCRH